MSKQSETEKEEEGESQSMWGPWILAGGAAIIGAGAIIVTGVKSVRKRIRKRRRTEK